MLFLYRQNLPALLDMFTHCGFLIMDQKTVSLMAMSSPNNVYNYQMTFKDTFSLSNTFKPDIDFGPIHGDDLYYMVNLLTSFIHFI